MLLVLLTLADQTRLIHLGPETEDTIYEHHIFCGPARTLASAGLHDEGVAADDPWSCHFDEHQACLAMDGLLRNPRGDLAGRTSVAHLCQAPAGKADVEIRQIPQECLLTTLIRNTLFSKRTVARNEKCPPSRWPRWRAFFQCKDGQPFSFSLGAEQSDS